MDCKYTYKEKKEALLSFINKNRSKNSKKKIICFESLTKKSDNCLYCQNPNIENNLFCNKICDLIYFSNLYHSTEVLIKHSSTELENINFIPFELMTDESIFFYKKLINEKISFDKMFVRKKIVENENELYFVYNFTFIKDFEKIKTKTMKISTLLQKTPFLCPESKNCLYCKKKQGKTYCIENKYYIGPFCSEFCYFAILKYIEICLSITKNKYFISLPLLNILTTNNILLMCEEKIENTIIETFYRDGRIVVYFTDLNQ